MRTRSILRALIPLAAAGILGAASAAAVEHPWVERWSSDLDTLSAELPKRHPNAFHHVDEADFDDAIEALRGRLPELEHHEVVVELASIVARLRDGHTRVTLPLAADSGFFQGHSATAPAEVPGLAFRPLPLRLRWLEDGLFVESIEESSVWAWGSRVETLGGRPIDDVIAAVRPVVHHDNEGQLRFQLPDFLVLPEVLQARGVVDDTRRVEIGLVTPKGETRTLRLEPQRTGSRLVGRSASEVSEPLYRRDNDRHYWFTHLPASRTLYWQYNEVGDGEGESLDEFSDRLFRRVGDEAVERLVIDLRWNRGGSNELNRPLLHRLIRSEKLRRPGSLFVITGGGTFSAAMMFAVDLERHTNALFVGENTGSSPNHYGDSRKLRLPESGLTVRISSLYWQYSGPRDERSAIEPHLRAAVTSEDVLAGRDPALRAILAGVERSEASSGSLLGSWRGRTTIDGTHHELVVDIGGEGAEASVLLSLPGFGVENAPIPKAIARGDEVAFERRFGETLLFLRGWREGDRLFGELGRVGAPGYPFVLEAVRDTELR